MSRYLCHDEPDLLAFEAEVLDSREGAVRLSKSAFYPGGGGQLPDQGVLEWHGGKIADMKAVAAGLALKRMGEPEEVAAAVLWLASDASSFVGGHNLSVDGGFLSQ